MHVKGERPGEKLSEPLSAQHERIGAKIQQVHWWKGDQATSPSSPASPRARRISMGNTKGLFIITIIVSLALLGVTSNQGGAQTSAATAQTSLGRIEPEAGTWKTWVLAS